MDPTRTNVTAINSSNLNEFRYYRIDPAATPVSCNITTTTTETINMEGFGLTGTTTTALLPKAVTTPTGSFMHVIPLQMTTQNIAGISSSSSTSEPSNVIRQMEIMTPTPMNSTSAIGQNNSSLDYYRVQQQLQRVTPTTTINVLVNDTMALTDNMEPLMGRQLEVEDASNSNSLIKTDNVLIESAGTTKAATNFKLTPTTASASGVIFANQEYVKQKAEADDEAPSKALNSLTSTACGIASIGISCNKQKDLQLQQKPQIIRKPKIVNSSSLQQTIQYTTTKTLPTIPKMLASNNYNSNCVDKSVINTFIQPSLEGALCKAPTTSKTTSTLPTLPASIDSSVVTQISNSVTLSIAKQTRPAAKKLYKPDCEIACVTLEKSNSTKENQNIKRYENTKTPVIMPHRSSTNTKQESLLKTKPAQHIILEITSPRTKRSKSLNNNSTNNNVEKMEDLASERRHSTASEGKNTIERSPKELTEIKNSPIPSEQTNTVEEGDKVITKHDSDHSIHNESLVEYEEEYLLEDENQLSGDDDNANNLLEEILDKSVKQKEEKEENKKEEKKGAVAAEESKEIKQEESEIINNPMLNDHTESSTGMDMPSKSFLILPCENEVRQEKLSSEISLLKIKKEEETEPDIDEQQPTAALKEEVIKPAEINTATNNRSLLCDGRMLPATSSSSTSTSSTSINNSLEEPPTEIVCTTNSTFPTIVKGSTISYGAKCPSSTDVNSYSTVLEMLSTFNMLSWKERIGTARGTNLRFQLNEFNLLQLHERCPPRYNIHTAYEKPIYERETLSLENTDPLLYLCRRCNCHGPAAEFLAPEFCSVECLKRDTRKRQRDMAGIPSRKRPRKEVFICSKQTTVNHQQPLLSANTAMPPSTSSLLVKKFFRWSTYLTGKCGEIAAPVDLFLNPFPTGPNNFQIGMKLEAIDPENCSLFCVCTVSDIQGYRLNLTFDGYDRMYNFWVNADSMDIFPPGWCAKTNRILQPPRGYEASKFNWPVYFAREKAVAAPRQLFTHLNSSASSSRNPFKIGMHLEAEDLNDTGKLCVATVSDVLDDRIRVHFDGWDDCYDYWVDINSPYIHPCGWHEGRQQLIVPPDFENSAFSWTEYLRDHAPCMMAPPSLFSAREPIDFRPKMKLEVVDPRNPILIRPATVIARKGHRIKLHLDLWPNEYCFWLEDDSPDLHPIGWCDATGHDLEPPPGFQARPALMACSVTGCRGIGNARRCNLSTHSTLESCPYAPENWNIKLEKLPRVESHDIERKVTAKAAHSEQQNILNKPRNEFRGRRSNEQRHTISKASNACAIEDTGIRASLLEAIKTRRSLQEEEQHQEQTSTLQSQDIDFSRGCALEKIYSIKQERDSSMPEESVSEGSSSSETSRLKMNSTKIAGSDITPQVSCDPANLQIAKEYLCDYGPRLQQNYYIWQQNLNTNYDNIKTNPLHWSTAESSSFVEKLLCCSKTASIFIHEDIDGAALLDLQQSDLTDILELKLGKAVKLYAHILQLRTWAVTKFNIKIGSKLCN